VVRSASCCWCCAIRCSCPTGPAQRPPSRGSRRNSWTPRPTDAANIISCSFELSATALAFNHTAILCTRTATIPGITVMAVVIAYVRPARRLPATKRSEFLATAPVAVPGIVLASGVPELCAAAFVLYGTLWILLIAFVTIAMPAAFSSSSRPPGRPSGSGGGEPYPGRDPPADALAHHGAAPAYQRDRHLVLHLRRRHRELSAAIMLFTSQTKVISVLIFDLNESGDLAPSQCSACSCSSSPSRSSC